MANAPVRKTSATPSQNAPSIQKAMPSLNHYYTAVSSKFRVAKYITVILLVAFLIVSFTFMRNDITLENLRYLLKFISFTNTETSISATKINYASGDPNRLDLFIGDLCTLSPEGYALYDSRGNQIMAEDIKYASPVLKVGDRFALCYDLDGTSFTVLNTFAKLYEGTTEYPITDGAIADDGTFAIASSSREYRTAITLYDSDFKAVTRVYKNDHLMGLELKGDASQFAVMTTSASGGKLQTKIELIAPGEDKALASEVLDGIGYTLYYMNDGMCVVADNGIYFLASDLSVRAFEKHSSTLAMTDCSGKYLTVIYQSGIIGNVYTARIFDKSGRVVFEGELLGKLVGTAADESGDYVFILNGTTLSRINLINKKLGTIPVVSDAVDIIVSDPQTVLVALKNYALTYKLDSSFEEHYYGRSDNSTDTQE